MQNIIKTLLMKVMTDCQYDTFKESYLTLKTDEDRVKFTLGLLRKENMLPKLPEPLIKSITASQEYREKGNKSFVTPWSASQLDTTIVLYTKSIVFALPGSRELALGYANRSAALFKTRLYQDCLQDISRALSLPYPDDLKSKLYARRARCLMTMKSLTDDQKEELKEALKMTAEYLDKMTANNQGRGIIEKMLQEPEKMIPAQSEYIKWRGEALMPKVSDENVEMKGVSSALKIEFNEEFGRHVVATRDISPGEVLAVIKPFAGFLIPEKWFTHCAYCMEQTWSSIPCEGCCEVVYCSEDCKNRAYDEHHDVECQVSRHLIALEMNCLSLLNIRLMVRAIKEAGSIQALRDKVEEIESRQDLKTTGFTQGFFDNKDYASIYTMARNTEKRPFIDLFEKSLKSSYMMWALATKSDLFGKKFDDNLDKLEDDTDVTFVGGLIMRHQQILPCNGYFINEEGLLMEPLKKGIVLIPFSQMSHSCNPCTTKIAYGMNMVFYANYAMRKGEQVFDNYGQYYRVTPLPERRKKLQEQFHFICKCIACAENWPTYSMAMPSFTCVSDEALEHATSVLRNYPKYHQLAINGNVTNDVDAIVADMNNMVKFLQKTVGLSCRELTEVIDTKKRILALTGNRFQSVNLNN